MFTNYKHNPYGMDQHVCSTRQSKKNPYEWKNKMSSQAVRAEVMTCSYTKRGQTAGRQVVAMADTPPNVYV